MLNSDQVNSIIRTVLKSAGGALVTHGVMTNGTAQWLIGLVAMILGAAWSHFTHAADGLPPNITITDPTQTVPVKQAKENSISSGPSLLLVLATMGLTSLLLVACNGLNRNLYSGEKLATDTVTGGRHTFNVWLQEEVSLAQQRGDSNRIEQLDLERDWVREQVYHYALAAQLVDGIRLEVATNSAQTNIAAAKVAMDTLNTQGSNIVWFISYFMKGGLLPTNLVTEATQ